MSSQHMELKWSTIHSVKELFGLQDLNGRQDLVIKSGKDVESDLHADCSDWQHQNYNTVIPFYSYLCKL